MTREHKENEIARAVIQILKAARQEVFQELMNELQPYDMAIQYSRLPKRHENLFLEYLQIDQLTELLRHLKPDEQLHVLRIIGSARSNELMELMKNDDLAFLLSNLPKSKADQLVSEMMKEEMESIQQTMNYPEKTAGRVMTKHYIWIHTSYTVEKAVQKLRSFSRLAHYIKYLYVIDDDKKLVGAVSYRDLLLAKPEDKIVELMWKNVISVDVLTHQEEVAKIIGRYDFASLPVVDEEGQLIGVITVDDVLDIVVREANEDIHMLLGSGKSVDMRTKPLTAAYRRLPWLIGLLFIGLISGTIIASFEATLEAVVALAFFMPLIAGMTGNTGTQSLAVVIRGLADEEITTKKIFRLIFREFLVGITIGLTCAIVIAVIAYFWQDSLMLGLVVGSSLLATLIIGTLAGTIIPLLLHKFKVDPAIASGPLITTVNDILSLLIYFGIASAFLSQLT